MPPPYICPFLNTRTAATFAQPRLCVVVDTEEEFDWDAALSRANTHVEAMRHVDRAQRVCEQFGVVPTYVVDYPVATQRHGYEQLKEWATQARCVIGAHLHPWVTPPFNEAVTNRNSFCSNLPAELQQQKLLELTEVIASNLGVQPLTFKAGRYGIGSELLDALEELGYDVDVSVNPHMDFRAIEGPDFTAFDCQAFWFGRRRRMLEVPCTQGYVGVARAVGRSLRRLAEQPPLRTLRAPGILARTGILNRVMLSPEGNTLDEMVALTRALADDGVRIFSMTFHSPSVEPGHTPYVRSQDDLQELLRRMGEYFTFFFDEMQGAASTPEDCRRDLLGAESGHA